MPYPDKFIYECSKCQAETDIWVTPPYTKLHANPPMNVRCHECGSRTHYKRRE